MQISLREIFTHAGNVIRHGILLVVGQHTINTRTNLVDSGLEQRFIKWCNAAYSHEP